MTASFFYIRAYHSVAKDASLIPKSFYIPASHCTYIVDVFFAEPAFL